jgi:hypothetical protein
VSGHPPPRADAAGADGAVDEPRGRARIAISELFVDKELSDDDLLRLRDELRQSGLSLAELDEIYYDELAPLLARNLRSPAGVWAGFDARWLQQQVERRRRRRPFAPLARLRRYLDTRSTVREWSRLRAMVASP